MSEKTKPITSQPSMGTISMEKLFHFLCGNCSKWWSIADPPAKPPEMFCPWCGEKQAFIEKSESVGQ